MKTSNQSQVESYTAKSKSEDQEANLVQCIGFYLGAELFGVDVLMVQEIIRKSPITSVPNAPAFIEGVINLRGNIVPVIDLRKRLNLDLEKVASEINQRILVISVDGRITGFIVDSVSKVMKISTDDIEPPPEIVVAGLKSKYIHGVCKIAEQILILLDFNRILQIEEVKKLKEFEDRQDSNDAGR